MNYLMEKAYNFTTRQIKWLVNYFYLEKTIYQIEEENEEDEIESLNWFIYLSMFKILIISTL